MKRYCWHYESNVTPFPLKGCENRTQAIAKARQCYGELVGDINGQFWVGTIETSEIFYTPRAIDVVELGQDNANDLAWLTNLSEKQLDELQEKIDVVWQNFIDKHALHKQGVRVSNVKFYNALIEAN